MHDDMKTAFLSRYLENEAYMFQPEGYTEEGQEQKVCKFNTAIYGLKQAARAWHIRIGESLRKYDFEQSKANMCLFKLWRVKSLLSHFYVNNEEYVKEDKYLKSRFEEAATVVGTKKFHAFIPFNKDEVQTKTHSFSDYTETYKIQISPHDEGILFEETVGYVACAYDNEWWEATVLSKDQVEEEGSSSKWTIALNHFSRKSRHFNSTEKLYFR
ncbi:hypothetical protein AVEN_53279-1 [Araneus ventricosus]|uniref:Reverse transcriptase Ty1/copia-type domain-containing protein n=1 Tax=Araneus ventricosus TaxID=182803 RepID=A0A4Y2A9S6_ARAVE|nr:hypothetical protein AVEN_53279-1 [Araneus ventricosus]